MVLACNSSFAKARIVDVCEFKKTYLATNFVGATKLRVTVRN